MLENFRVALRKQRKLIVIFLVTVFIPALSLGVFGIRAIRSERFRQARQIENEQRRIAERLRSHVSAGLHELELALQSVTDSPAFRAADEKAVAELSDARLGRLSLVETVFYYYGNEAPRFPGFDRALPANQSRESWTRAATVNSGPATSNKPSLSTGMPGIERMTRASRPRPSLASPAAW
jgi:hypothetical protein